MTVANSKAFASLPLCTNQQTFCIYLFLIINTHNNSEHAVQHCAKLESCTVSARATLCATFAEEESAPTSATSRATVSPCVYHLQHCVQLCDAMLRAMMHRVPAP